MTQTDIRWKQRFSNFQKALRQLTDACELSHQRPLSLLEKQGLIQAFEYTYELGWNTLRDYLMHQGIQNMIGARDTIREAFSRDLIFDGEGWMKMLEDRNKTSHTYNEQVAQEIVKNVTERHLASLQDLRQKMGTFEAGL